MHLRNRSGISLHITKTSNVRDVQVVDNDDTAGEKL